MSDALADALPEVSVLSLADNFQAIKSITPIADLARITVVGKGPCAGWMAAINIAVEFKRSWRLKVIHGS
jgi:hypothetical protein